MTTALRDVLTPSMYAHGIPHDLFRELRRERSVVWVDEPIFGGRPAVREQTGERGGQQTPALLLEPLCLGGRKRLVKNVRQRRPAPQGERVTEHTFRFLGFSRGRCVSCRAHEALEAIDIELARLDSQEVPAWAALESIAAKRAAQPRDVSVERLLDARRRPLAPERVDQPVARDDLVRVQHEHGEQRALLRAAERDEPAVDPHLERAENRGLHATSKARL